DRNLLPRSGDGQADVQGRGLPNGQQKTRLPEWTEAWELDRHVISANRQQQGAKDPVLVRYNGPARAGFDVLDYNLHIRQNRSRLIRDGTVNRSRCCLQRGACEGVRRHHVDDYEYSVNDFTHRILPSIFASEYTRSSSTATRYKLCAFCLA